MGLPTLRDDGVIETSLAPQDGRITNISVPTYRSGDSSKAGAGSTKRWFGVQSDYKRTLQANSRKNRNRSKRTNRFIHCKNAAVAASGQPARTPRKKTRKNHLTLQPLSEMGHLTQSVQVGSDQILPSEPCSEQSSGRTTRKSQRENRRHCRFGKNQPPSSK